MLVSPGSDPPPPREKPFPATRPREERILVRDGRRHHRRTYSATEFRIGLVCVVGLVAIGAWVAWRGAHPDPELFKAIESLGGAPAAAPAEPAAVDRGPLPDGLASDGWTEGSFSTFGYDDLYVKIDGREGYYKDLGFRQLWFVSILSDADPTAVVDIETYDLGETANALGAAAGELPAGASPVVNESGFTMLHRNALYLTRGNLYVRAIGSSESEAVRRQLEHLRARLDETLEGEPLPWAYALFAGELGLDPGVISYAAENAFSFGFARDVYSAVMNDETEIFVVATDPDGAVDLASRFAEGFLGYGSAVEGSMDVQWVRDRYIQTVSGAKAAERWTIGVRGAPDVATAEKALADLERAVRDLGEGQ